MKIHMGNIGMTLHIIHKLRAQGIDNVQVNMDWQHLIMNGENLAEYAALLAAEGLLGHQHGNSGWGTFDDDNMVGATAFMETLELALELRRANYGANGERLGLDLYPYTEDQVGGGRAARVLQWRFIDGVAARIDDAALREAQSRKDAVRAYELVYAALGAMSVAIGIDVGTTGRQGARGLRGRRGRLARARGRVRPARRRGRAGPSRTRRTGGARRRRRSSSSGRTTWRGIGLSGQMHGLVALDADEQVLRPAILWNDQRTGAECEEIEQRIGLEQLIARDRQPRADRLHRAEAAVAASTHEPERPRADRAHPAAEGLRAAAAVRRAGDRRRRRVGHAAVRRRAPALERRGAARRSSVDPRDGCRARSSRPRCRARRATASRSPPAPATRRRARSASASTHAGEPLSVVLGTSGVVFAALPAFAADPRGARARVLPRGAGDLARDGRDAQRGGRAALAARRDRRRATIATLDGRGGGAGSPGSRA